MNKMIKIQCLFHLIHLFLCNPGSKKMMSDNLNSGHFGYTFVKSGCFYEKDDDHKQ